MLHKMKTAEWVMGAAMEQSYLKRLSHKDNSWKAKSNRILAGRKRQRKQGLVYLVH